MLVAVHMIEREAGFLVGAELSLDLRFELRPQGGPRADIKSKLHEIRTQMPGCIDEIRDALERHCRPSLDQHQMQANAQAWYPARALGRVCGRRSGHHQASRAQDALPVRQLHRFVDLGREPEVVGGDDETLQAATSRWRRNLKNSTPSRSRRFIISGLRTISPTIDAIFGARK
jgi:hypothetical protein